MLSMVGLPLSQRLAESMLDIAHVAGGIGSMTKPKHMRALAIKEKHCPACGGTGIAKVKQPVVPGRRIYSPPCKECGGKGRIAIDAN